MRITGEGFPGSVRVIAPHATSRAWSVADSYINPERLMDDIARLYASRDRIMISLTALDCAAIAAGTPIRSTSARERFMDLGMRLRDIEAIARQAWQSEIAAAGGYKPALRPILVKAGEFDARGLKNLITKNGKHINATEYEELLAILEGAIVQAREAGIEEYAASLFTNLDPKTLDLLVDPRGLQRENANRLELQRMSDVLAELRDLFTVIVTSPDLQTRFPKLWSHLTTMNPTAVLTLLQTGRGLDANAPLLKGANSNLLANIANRMLTPNPRLAPNDNFISENLCRPVVLRLLREDQLNNGNALSLFLSSPAFNDAGLITVSRHLEALTEIGYVSNTGAWTPYTEAENQATAELLKTHFTNTFDKGTKTEVLQATSLIEIAIAKTSELTLSKPMKEAFAIGFAGTMTHQLTRDDLLRCTFAGLSTDRSALAEAQASWAKPTVKVDGNRLQSFLTLLADEPNAIKTIAAALGPMVALAASSERQVPIGNNLPNGIGFIYGCLIRKFDSDSKAKRAFFDGLGLSLTVLFATAGGLAGGPGVATATGLLGSGILQSITSLIDIDPKTVDGMPMTENGMREYFLSLYVMASYKWLTTSTQRVIMKELSMKVVSPEVQPVLSIVNGMLKIANANLMTPSDLRRISNQIHGASINEVGGVVTPDLRAIDLFLDRATRTAALTRKAG